MEADLRLASPLVIGATGMDAIIQNIRIIATTFAYSVPLDRGFAHLGGFLDTPTMAETARKMGGADGGHRGERASGQGIPHPV